MTPPHPKQEKRKGPPGRDLSPPPLKRRVQSTTTQDRVTLFFKPFSEKPPEQISWNILNSTLLIAHYKPSNEFEQQRRQVKHRRIAGFDLDGTLLKTKSGNRFSKDATDWVWWDNSIPTTLKKLDNDGYQVVIFSNQAGISLKTNSKSVNQDHKGLSNFKVKISAVMNHFDFPVSLYAATERDVYRKPRKGMWKEMIDHYDLDDADGVDLGASFFVGDAGGRVGDEKSVEADFASSDRDFATNIGIGYHSPEEYFLRAKAKPFKRAFDPATYLAPVSSRIGFTKTNSQELVLFVGSPGSGKSTFYQTRLAPLSYERINQDLLKTRDKCLTKATEFLKQGLSVAIDNTNPARDTRALWINLAKSFNLPIRCIVFTAESLLCQHNDAVRGLNPIMNPESRTILPRMAFSGFASQLEIPSLDEGFQDITVVNFTFQGTEEQRTVWAQYYI